MERITISLEENLAQEFDNLISSKAYKNRSEAVRDILRQYIETNRITAAKAPNCIANVSYVYNHHERDLAKRMNDIQHQHHDLTISAMHAHLDHENCIETLFLKGDTKEVQACAEKILAERGVRHGLINLVPADAKISKHSHASAHAHPHMHLKPKT
jgi:CopG family nickel-responsive transcriptional regulator